VTIPAENLRRFAVDVFVAKGMRAADAQTVANTLLWADLRGVGTHGVSRIPQYCGFMDKGQLDPRAAPQRVTDLPGSAKLDAQRAAGPVAMQAATEVAMEKARAGGVGLVLVAHTTHTGALGCYTQALARQGFAGIAFAATIPWMVYHGAAAAAAGTNPISIAMPGAGADPILLDMTTGATSTGQLVQARRTGKPLPEGVAADEHGRPVTDPQQAKLVLPLGGAKGSGLSLMIELLVSHLAGNPIIAEELAQSGSGKRHRQNALVLAIDCSRFVAPAMLAEMTQRLVHGIKGLPPVDPAQEVRLPGERGDQVAAQRSRDGVPVPPPVQAELATLARSLGLDVQDYWT
jgi:LDH2 family malate/lactate/ureidoglycolate dehydrogenase